MQYTTSQYQHWVILGQARTIQCIYIYMYMHIFFCFAVCMQLFHYYYPVKILSSEWQLQKVSSWILFSFMNVHIQHSLYCRCLFNIESSNLTTLFYRAKQSSSLGIIAPAFGVVAFICGFSFAATQLLPCQDSNEDDIQIEGGSFQSVWLLFLSRFQSVRKFLRTHVEAGGHLVCFTN